MIGISGHFASQPSIPVSSPTSSRGDKAEAAVGPVVAPIVAPSEPGSTATPENSKKVSQTVSTQNSETTARKKGDVETTKNTSGLNDKKAELLTAEDLKQIEKLKQRDIEVRAHEAAHLAAAGQYATSGAKFQFSRGPDGRSYAIGGSVGIDTSPEATPEATIRKAEQVMRAALAPAEPSGQDRSVAASAASLKLAAQAELAQAPREQYPKEAENSENRSERLSDREGDTLAGAGLSTISPSNSSASEPSGSSKAGQNQAADVRLSANLTKLSSYQAIDRETITRDTRSQIDQFA